MRFFFDYTSDDDAILDYKGEEFRASEPAIDYGRTIADHLRHALNEKLARVDNLPGSRDIQGKTVHRLPIDGPELEAA